MSTFAEFLTDTARKGEAVNILFEERLFDLVGILHRISHSLLVANVPHELIGGLAVLVHVEEADPAHSMLTRDVDLLVRREDLERIKDAAHHEGFRFRHTAGVDMLLYGDTVSARNAVHLLFSGEKVKPSQETVNPPIAPEKKSILGQEVMVISLGDLVCMKLSSYRLKDQVHVQVMDAAGLITPFVEQQLTPELLRRLRHVRETD